MSLSGGLLLIPKIVLSLSTGLLLFLCSICQTWEKSVRFLQGSSSLVSLERLASVSQNFQSILVHFDWLPFSASSAHIFTYPSTGFVPLSRILSGTERKTQGDKHQQLRHFWWSMLLYEDKHPYSKLWLLEIERKDDQKRLKASWRLWSGMPSAMLQCLESQLQFMCPA